MSDESTEKYSCIAYGIVYLPTKTFVYVGHTKRRDGVRSSEHYNLSSGARRVVTAFAQEWLTPNDAFFEFVVLWNGRCTASQIKAVEQYFIDLHDTRVYPRPTNGVTKDIDLMQYGSVPSKLNINVACRDPSLMAWALSRIKQDFALTIVPTKLEKLELDHELAIERARMNIVATETASAVLKTIVAKYRNMEVSSVVYATDIHADMVRVSQFVTDDDGAELKTLVQNRIQLYDIDRCSTMAPFRPITAAIEFDILLCSCTPFPTPSDEYKSKRELAAVEHAAKKQQIEAQVEHEVYKLETSANHELYIFELKQILEMKTLATKLGTEDRKAELDKRSYEIFEKAIDNIVGVPKK